LNQTYYKQKSYFRFNWRYEGALLEFVKFLLKINIFVLELLKLILEFEKIIRIRKIILELNFFITNQNIRIRKCY
jgi:hypothetical protein